METLERARFSFWIGWVQKNQQAIARFRYRVTKTAAANLKQEQFWSVSMPAQTIM